MNTSFFASLSQRFLARQGFFQAFVAIGIMSSFSNGLAVEAKDFLFRGTGTKLPCRLYVPPAARAGAQGYDPATKYPLVVFLHGFGEKGSDNTSQLKGPGELYRANGAFVFAEQPPPNQAFLLAPQCPKDNTPTVGIQNNWQNGGRANLVLQEIDRIRKEYGNIDDDRIYLTGLSLGGTGAWHFLTQASSPYAAAVPICGVTELNWATALVNIPVWVYHGVNDGTINIQFSRDLVDRIRSKGGTPILTEVDGVGHNAWTPAYANSRLVEWLFAQRRGKTSSVTPHLAITSPPSGAPDKVDPSPTLVLSGTATEAAKPVRVFARHHKLGINIPGELKPPANGTTQWACTTDLVDGENQVSVIVEGSAAGPSGGSDAKSHTFFSAPARFIRTAGPQRKWFFDLGAITRIMNTLTWNNVVTPIAGDKVTDAIDSSGAKTPLDLSFIKPFVDINGLGVKQDGPFPMNAQMDTMYVQDTQVAQLRFAGLSHTSRYSLTLFASRETPGNRITKYTVNDTSLLAGAQKSILYNPTDNVNGLAIFNPLRPDPTGAIDLSVQTDDGTGFAYLGVVQVGEKPLGKLLFDFNANDSLSTRPFWNNVTALTDYRGRTTIPSGTVVRDAVNSDGVVTPVQLVIEPGFEGVWDTGLTASTVYPASAQRDAFYVKDAKTASLRVYGLRPLARYNLRFLASAPPPTSTDDRMTSYTVGTASVLYNPLQNPPQAVQLPPIQAPQSGELIIKVATPDGKGTACLGVLEISEIP